jgi:hypothetical protein
MIALSIVLLPLGVAVLFRVMAWTERRLDRPTQRRSVSAANNVAVSNVAGQLPAVAGAATTESVVVR